MPGADGGIYVQLREDYDEERYLAQFDPDTGGLVPESRMETPFAYSVNLGLAEGFPAVVGNSRDDLDRRVMKLDMGDGGFLPLLFLHREIFEAWRQWTIEKMTAITYINGVENIPYYHDMVISEEMDAEYRRAIEEARPLPTKTAPIIKIIQEDAEDYFNGSKDAEAISQVVNNRVQLYLDEGK